MLICHECGAIFGEEEIKAVHYPGTMYEPPNTEYYSPCGHDDYDNAEFCSECCKYVTKLDVDFEICEDCLKDCFKNINKVKESLSEKEREILDYYLEVTS